MTGAAYVINLKAFDNVVRKIPFVTLCNLGWAAPYERHQVSTQPNQFLRSLDDGQHSSKDIPPCLLLNRILGGI